MMIIIIDCVVSFNKKSGELKMAFIDSLKKHLKRSMKQSIQTNIQVKIVGIMLEDFEVYDCSHEYRITHLSNFQNRLFSRRNLCFLLRYAQTYLIKCTFVHYIQIVHMMLLSFSYRDCCSCFGFIFLTLKVLEARVD